MLSPVVAGAIKSGIVPKVRNWRRLATNKLTKGERVCLFIERHLPIPEGPDVGKPVRLRDFQVAFILAIFDGPRPARRAILSVGRKAGKTALAAALVGAFMFMDGLAPRNSRLNSGALSREQSALIFNYLAKSLQLSPQLADLAKVTPSGKKIEALNTGITYTALAAEAGKAMGLSPAVAVLDELGAVNGPTHPFAEAILTSQGAHKNPLSIIISTQAASDADWLSIQIDDAIRNPSDDVVCHLYAADADCALDDREQWEKACPALGAFRSIEDVAHQAAQAVRLPVVEGSFRNLILNQRIALESLWLAPAVWKACSGEPDLEVFRTKTVAIGLDLSARNDLTAAVCAARDDDGVIHLLPFVFTPMSGLEERSRRDRAPYDAWCRDGQMVAVPGASIDYDFVATWLRDKLDDLGIVVSSVCFDRWRIDVWAAAAAEVGFATGATQVPVGQGFKDMSPRCEAFMSLLLEGKVRHGSHSLLNLAAANAIAVRSPAGDVKIDKAKATMRVDPLVASVMAAFQVSEGRAQEIDVLAWVA